jgi:uncharacterized protein YbjT (DUF2867 family)
VTVLVTGATGTVGRHVVRHLLEAGQKVRALTRNPAGADLPDGVEVVAGDLGETRSLAPAFDGVEAAHLINFHGDYRPLRNGQQIADLAGRSGLRKVTLLGGWEESTLEPAVRAGALEWTALRPIEFMANTLADWGERLRTEGVVHEPYGDRMSAPVHEADIAAVAAVALTEDGHAGRTYHLTGPEVVTPRDKVRILAAATGRDLRFDELSPERAREEWANRLPDLLVLRVLGDGIATAERIELLLRLYGNIPEIGYTVTDTVERVTGRPARTFARWAAEHADRFRG